MNDRSLRGNYANASLLVRGWTDRTMNGVTRNMIEPQSETGDPELLKRLCRQQQALIKVGSLWRRYEGALTNAAGVVTEAAALALDVGRAGIWTFDSLRSSLENLDLYQADMKRHLRGGRLAAKDYPIYFDALAREEILQVSDAPTAPHTRALFDSYLRPNAIGAMLVAPIHAGARLAGVLCLEHVGGKRHFHQDEINTAVHLASAFSAALEFQYHADERHKMQAHLRDQVALWSIFFEQNRDGISVLRTDGSVYRANKRFADMLGYTVDEAHQLHVWEWDSQFDRDTIVGMLQSVDFSGDHFDTRHQRKDGRVIDVEVTSNGAYYNGTKLIFCNHRDITERKRDQQEIHKLATTDTLTGIASRGEFSRILSEEIDRATRYGRPLALIMYDIDHFKRVNDTFGHHAGDEVLKTVVDLVNEHLRRVDTHGRWGGEEFMVLLPETSLAAALVIAERLCQAIGGQGFDPVGSVTASFGVTLLGQEDGFDVLVKRADEALYRAKNGGRNRVESAVGPATDSVRHNSGANR
ncbi:sensor domain-containing diguanylate cyclase [Halopseudomonas pelagia]|uniref:sensor domain-containing diguanylate cyclase n=1 Tax=Halopseudomonas pelagia TaxID=553151 RepID=UPI0003B5A6FD|nr:diguanylate cyclase [Halopseudomonas pelagia]